MNTFFTLLPFVLIVAGMAILFWPRKPLPEPGSVDSETFHAACAAFNRETWRRFRFAVACHFLALLLAVIL